MGSIYCECGVSHVWRERWFLSCDFCLVCEEVSPDKEYLFLQEHRHPERLCPGRHAWCKPGNHTACVTTPEQQLEWDNKQIANGGTT